ncbi:hypothetical protein BDF19DRAFT_455459 [Syncephalis fuscata]|nr:hypothetical protein BDF19DRAFT_455459 [Syncephalis fuscata]
MVAATTNQSSPNQTPSATAPLTDRVMHMVMHLQFLWWIGHVIVVITTFLFYLCYFTSYYSVSVPAYSVALIGAMSSYAVASYKSIGPIQFNMQFAAQLSANDSVQYLTLALIWYSQPALLATAAPADAKPFVARLSATADMAARKNYTIAMHFVARWEVSVILAWVVIQTLLFQLSFFTPFAYMMFLRNRYICSAYHQEAFRNLRTLMDRQLVNNPNAHTGLRRLYVSTRDFISSLAGPLHMPHQAAQ